MRRAPVYAAVLALAAASPVTAALPAQGTLVPGRSLGGVHLGEPAAQVQAALGVHGVCHSCAHTTWYFTYKPFDRHGLGVELTRGRVSGVYTLWQPDGWTAPRGLVLGAFEAQVSQSQGTLVPTTCTGYQALVRDSATARTVFYLLGGKLWGFGLFAAGDSPCR